MSIGSELIEKIALETKAINKSIQRGIEKSTIAAEGVIADYSEKSNPKMLNIGKSNRLPVRNNGIIEANTGSDFTIKGKPYGGPAGNTGVHRRWGIPESDITDAKYIPLLQESTPGNLPAIIKQEQKNTTSGQSPWAHPIKVALGTAVGGAALLAALNSSRGQQNNAQLYGQQPLY